MSVTRIVRSIGCLTVAFSLVVAGIAAAQTKAEKKPEPDQLDEADASPPARRRHVVAKDASGKPLQVLSVGRVRDAPMGGMAEMKNRWR